VKAGSFILFAALSLFLAGCNSVKSVRDEPGTRETFTSSKPAELLAACIGDAWDSLSEGQIFGHAGTKTNRTVKGWAVIAEYDTEHISGIADLTEQGKQTTVVYSAPSRTNSERLHLPGIRACL
jgi:hypothetical protein